MDGGFRVIARISFVSMVDVLRVYNYVLMLVSVAERSSHVLNLPRTILEVEV